MRNATIMFHGIKTVEVTVKTDPDVSSNPMIKVFFKGKDGKGDLTLFCDANPRVSLVDERGES